MAKAIVIYDGDCGFCKWCLAILLRAARPGAFRPLPLGSAEADALLADLTIEEREASWHLVEDEGAADASRGSAAGPSSTTRPGAAGRSATVRPGAAGRSSAVRFSAGAALAPAMDLVRGGAIPAALFRRFPGASERGYRWVAEHRSPLGRLVGGRARRWAGRVVAAHGGPPQ